mgnify:CR=1 FL=1
MTHRRLLSRPLQALALAAAVFLTGCAIKPASPSGEAAEPPAQTITKIGRASCRERV